MSENVLNHFLSLLSSGNYNVLVEKYYADIVNVILDNMTKTNKKTSAIQLLQKVVEPLQILQFKVADIEYTANHISYIIYLVTMDENHQIDFSEHQILNKWQDNLICYHKHLVINQ